MKNGLLFANAVAKAKEENLFSEERLGRMVECQKLEDAVKILVEANYGGGTIVENAVNFDEILVAEENLTLSFIHEIDLKDVGFECFFLRADYHNAKALLKAEFQNEDAARMIMRGGLIAVADLKEKLTREVTDINPYIDSAVKAIREAFETSKSPRLIDTQLDKAMFDDISDRLRGKRMDKYVKMYFEAYIDCLNIGSYVRTARIAGTDKFFISNFVSGGLLSEKSLLTIFPDVPKLCELLNKTQYSKLAEKVSIEEMAAFDAARDNYLLDIFRENRNDMFSIAPVMGYYLAKLNEIKVLRVVLVCIKNGVEKAEILKRLRLMYA